jgi:hypothetical protein
VALARIFPVLIVAAFVAPGCVSMAPRTERPHPVVGTWLVRDPNAPFPYHMYVFNADHTLQQANPDAGDARGSDSDGKGIWSADGEGVKGKWMEVRADRATHAFAGRLEISFRLRVSGDSLTGIESVRVFDANGVEGEAPPTPAPIEGKRMTLP